MAKIDRRVGKTGVTWRVRWREGGGRTGRPDSETCDTETDAKNFAALVLLAGERRPEGYPKGCRGRKLLPTGEPDPEPEPSAPTYAEVVEEYLATLVDADPRTVAEYRRAFRTHVRPAMVILPGGAVVGPLGDLPMDECADPDLWQAWVGHMRAKTYGKKTKRHYAPKTILNIHGTVVAPVFEYAIFRGYCTASPCRWVRLPERKGRPIKAHHVLDVEEFQAWIGFSAFPRLISCRSGVRIRWESSDEAMKFGAYGESLPDKMRSGSAKASRLGSAVGLADRATSNQKRRSAATPPSKPPCEVMNGATW